MAAAEVTQGDVSKQNGTTTEQQQEEKQNEEENDNAGAIDLSALDTWIDKDVTKYDNPLKTKKVLQQEINSREAFRSRLRTFLPWTYYCKPPSLSPIVCARFGYVAVHSSVFRSRNM